MCVIYILKAMGPRNTLVIRYCCHGLKYNRQEFFLRSGLKPDLDLTPSHMKTHSGEKPHKCEQCPFATSRPDVLRAHRTRHSGERPRKCDQCDYATSHLDSLKTHRKKHTGEEPLKCNITVQCNYSTHSKSNLRQHFNNHHK